jgi:hypothetical protein
LVWRALRNWPAQTQVPAPPGPPADALINKLVEKGILTEKEAQEEKNASDIIEQLLMIDAKGTAVLMLDHQLGKRGE